MYNILVNIDNNRKIYKYPEMTLQDMGEYDTYDLALLVPMILSPSTHAMIPNIGYRSAHKCYSIMFRECTFCLFDTNEGSWHSAIINKARDVVILDPTDLSTILRYCM